MTLRPGRLVRLMHRAVDRCRLDLTGRRVLTEAATGAYVSTAVLAALAGAQVTALTRGTKYGTVDEVREWTDRVAAAAGVTGAIEVVEELSPAIIGRADVVTNSGHLRPLDAAFVQRLSPRAVVPLMMEAWEIGAGRVDVDLTALRRRGIAFAGTNEREPAVGVFAYLGVMAVKLLVDGGIAVHGSDVLLLCDNPFAEHVAGTLRACGANVTVAPSTRALRRCEPVDAVLVALTPAEVPRVTAEDLAAVAERMPDAVVAQFFGDVDRTAAEALDVNCWPDRPPPHGHMGVLPHEIGPEPVVRLQSGGLKVAQVLLTPEDDRTDADRGYLDVL
ncbi:MULTISPECIES: hypothetical protein [unclassified Blastococcus]